MASPYCQYWVKKKGKPAKASSQRVPRTTSDLAEEEHFTVEVDGDSVPKDAHVALKTAFDDIKKKLVSSKKHNKELQEKTHYYTTVIKRLEEKLEFCSSIVEENEALKEKLELSFKAFDEKYKESKNLQMKLAKANEEEEDKHREELGEEQQDLVGQKDETDTLSKTNIDLAEIESVDSFTQTPDEKTDELGCVHTSTPTELFKSCGLEIVVENGKYYLMLIERDALKRWIENETDGKVIVTFEKTPVFERFVQTDPWPLDELTIQERLHSKECLENKKIVIQLKNKIVDQASLIKRYRAFQATLTNLQRNNESKQVVSTSSALVQTEDIVHDKQIQMILRYKGSVMMALRGLKQKMTQLNKELDYQKFYSKRLLHIISNSMDVPKIFISSVLNASRGMPNKTRKLKKPPVPRAALLDEEKIPDYPRLQISPPESCASIQDPLLSMPVQETDRRLRVKISKVKDPDYDASLDKEAFSVASAGSRSSSSESSASIVPAEEGRTMHILQVDNIFSGMPRDIAPTQTSTSSSSSSSHRADQVYGQDDGDDIEVIGEDEAGAAGGTTGTKQCPMCFLLFTPGTSQLEYEKHVTDHLDEN